MLENSINGERGSEIAVSGPTRVIGTTPCWNADVFHLQRENNSHRRFALTFSCLGKLTATNGLNLARWKTYLMNLFKAAMTDGGSRRPLVIGLTESGIVPSALVHQIARQHHLNAHWVCSTRRPARGFPFLERHSHGPHHVVPLPDVEPGELWIVEDEITTGRTILNLAVRLCRLMDIKRVRFFAIVDARHSSCRRQFEMILKDHGMMAATHTLLERPRPVPDHAGLGDLFDGLDAPSCTLRSGGAEGEDAWLVPAHRPALRGLAHVDLPVSVNMHGSLLVVGEAIDLGLHLVQKSPGLSFRHITMSPWEVDDKTVESRLDFCNRYFLYNFHRLQPPLFLLNDPLDAEIAREITTVLGQVGLNVRNLPLFS